jgi:hypothetical protein
LDIFLPDIELLQPPYRYKSISQIHGQFAQCKGDLPHFFTHRFPGIKQNQPVTHGTLFACTAAPGDMRMPPGENHKSNLKKEVFDG